MFKTNIKALNSYLAYTYNDFKKLITIGGIICASIYIAQIVVLIIISNIGSSNSNSGMLITGTAIFLITFMIGIFVTTSNRDIKNVFRFPINRPTYALGNLIYILIASLAVIAAVSAFYVFETLTNAVLSALIEDALSINTVSIGGYLEGILPTYATIVFALSMIYMLSMYFHRYKLPFAILLALIIFAIIFIPGFHLNFVQAFTFGFRIKSILPFTLYMLGVSLAAHLLAFIPLKLMEVK